MPYTFSLEFTGRKVTDRLVPMSLNKCSQIPLLSSLFQWQLYLRFQTSNSESLSVFKHQGNLYWNLSGLYPRLVLAACCQPSSPHWNIFLCFHTCRWKLLLPIEAYLKRTFLSNRGTSFINGSATLQGRGQVAAHMSDYCFMVFFKIWTI